MNKKLTIFITAIFIIAAIGYNIYYSPEIIAGSSDRCFNFFSLSNDYTYRCADFLYSQGRKFEDFGSKSYFLTDLDETQFSRLVDELRRKGAVETDSTIVLTVHRGNIIGTFRFMPYGSPYKIIVNYTEDNL